MDSIEYPREYVAPGGLRRIGRHLVPYGAREAIRSRMLDRPVTHEIYSWLDPSLRWRRTTIADIVIEGSARSGNSYARYAFDYANEGRYNIASHIHSARPIEIGARRGIPTIVLIRDPREVLASTVQYQRAEDPVRVVDVYCDIYRRVLPLLDRVMLAEFPDVISDYGAVIERCNRRFGTSFTPYVKTAAAEAEVARRIRGVVELSDPDRVEQMVPLPSADRRPADQVVSEMPDEVKRALVGANSIYVEVRAAAQESR